MHYGGLSYAAGYLAKWELFMSQIERTASTAAYMISQVSSQSDYLYCCPFLFCLSDRGHQTYELMPISSGES
jgi:hypothetical protein